MHRVTNVARKIFSPFRSLLVAKEWASSLFTGTVFGIFSIKDKEIIEIRQTCVCTLR
jgi:hypothetical protein